MRAVCWDLSIEFASQKAPPPIQETLKIVKHPLKKQGAGIAAAMLGVHPSMFFQYLYSNLEHQVN